MKKNILVFRLITVIYILGMFFFANQFSFMGLNVLLAWIPIELSHLVVRLQRPFERISVGIVWFLFYPNIPYLLTDFFHLQVLDIYTENAVFHTEMQEWIAFGLLTAGIIAYLIVGLFSTLKLMVFFKKEWKIKQWYILIVMFLLTLFSSLGIYVGRFLRLHSIDFFLSPISTFKAIFFEWSVNKVIFILIFALLQLILFLALLFGTQFLNADEE